MIVKNNKYLFRLLVLGFIVLTMTCGGKKETPPVPKTVTQTQAESVKTQNDTTAITQKIDSTISKLLAEKPVAPSNEKAGKYMVISVKQGNDYLGKIKIELNDKEAPKTAENLRTLVKKGFYNGLTFHRVISGFVIQGGCPKGDGTGGPGYTTPAEISPNLKHDRGAVAMARLGDQMNPKRESSGSQFYICHGSPNFLDGQYTIVGKVVSGMDVVDKIAGTKTGPGDKPITPVVMEKVTLE
jgi:cyclophilin family peptidyl-prolyl cis-trans isomerase